jgi:hypothetical protein
MSIGLSVITFFAGVRHEDSSNKQFCQLLDVTTSHPVTRPTNPSLDPSRELTWEKYKAVIKLSKRIGC